MSRSSEAAKHGSGWYVQAMERLVEVVQELSLARDLGAVTDIVRRAARELTGADGATFVLREGDRCFYADEDAISPLWKGQRFPVSACISGWVMLNREPAVIEDIYKDPRIPTDVYRLTFVKSMAMVPIRREAPIGAIGNYWARHRRPDAGEVTVLQALADVTSVTMENVGLYGRLQEKMRALERSNEELSRFAWSAAHDLKSPLRAIDGISAWIAEDLEDRLEDGTRDHLHALRKRVQRMGALLDDILEYSNLENGSGRRGDTVVDGATLIDSVTSLLYIPEGFTVTSTGRWHSVRAPLLPVQRVLCNLVNNAIKHHDGKSGSVEVGVDEQNGCYVFTVKDDGPGIASKYHGLIFEMFKTLRPRDRVEGSGMGLAIAKKIVELNGGELTVDSEPGRGAVFRFSWPKTPGLT